MTPYDDSNFPNRSIGYLVRIAHQLGSALLEPIVVAEGMSLMHWSAMMAIRYDRGSKAADFSRDLGHDTGAMTRLVDQMASRRWVRLRRVAWW